MAITFRQPFTGSYPITLDFGEEWLPVYKEGEHKGIDFGCPENTPILASADGTVIRADYDKSGYGNYILILHSDMSGTLYAHLNHMMVMKGKAVSQGDIIAYSGNTGNSSGPHLHFELRTEAEKYSSAIDPKLKLRSFSDSENANNNSEKEDKADSLSSVHRLTQEGYHEIVCDVANVRCHRDPSRIIGQRVKGDEILILKLEPTMYCDLPYYEFFDRISGCKGLIAAYDKYGTQMLEHV